MKHLLFALLALFFAVGLCAQSPKESYLFTDIKVLGTTPVKDQARSGTCWSFSGIGQLESDLLRMYPQDSITLSEMWIVRHAYMNKAIKYIRLNGISAVGPGGNTHDIFHVIKHHGIVPEEVYPGLNYGTDSHIHGELQEAIAAYMGAIAKNPNKTLSTAWQAGLDGILDAYLGEVPEKFTYRGKEYTPESFAASLGVNWEDYISFTSFTHHPFYTQFALEIPDNWLWGLSYNIPIDELERVIDYSLEKGYTVTWSSDVSEPGFLYRKGYAVMPATKLEELSGSDMSRWTGITADELKDMSTTIDGVVPERSVTQEERQEAFDNFQTTDDHGMLIMGIAQDQFGNKFYKVKNSWGDSNLYHGYFYVSPTFVKFKTTNLNVHRNGIPEDLKAKLKL